MSTETGHASLHGVAVVGIGCRLPGAADHREFAANVLGGVSSIREVTADRWDVQRYYSPDIATDGKTVSKWCGQIDDVHCFDNAFFRIPPREAALMDPQQRLLLEESWRCVEDSGIALEELQGGRTSVHVGVMARDHLKRVAGPVSSVQSHSAIGGYDCMLANRLSHTLGLRGASVAIDAACASSLVAIHMGIRALLDDEADFALAGGVSLNLHPWRYVSFSKARMLSPDGRCMTFDRDANGYVPGEGVGVVLLRRLTDAVRDADHIYGVLTGSAVNHGGARRTITAPTVASQRDVVTTALRRSGADPRTVGYLEAHGTGTSLGDPVEVEALRQVFGRECADGEPWCWLGAVKPNIGHLEAAAGVAGLIKVLMMMGARRIPPSVNLRYPNPLIELEGGPFKLAREQHAWTRLDPAQPRRAGVSSFGMGGVNSHVVVEESVDRASQPDAARGRHPFLLSASSEPALERLLGQWRRATDRDGWLDADVADVCATLATGRRHLDVRIGGLLSSRAELDRFVRSAPQPRRKPTSQRWWIRVADVRVPAARELRALLRTAPLRPIREAVAAQAPEAAVLLDRLQAGRRGPAERCAFAYLILRQALDCGLAPEAVASGGPAVWPVLAAAGVLDLAAAARAAKGDRDGLPEPQLPRFTLVEPQTGCLLRADGIDRDYLEQLARGVDVAAAEARAVLARTSELVDSQHTLRAYLQVWNEGLADRGLGAWSIPMDRDGLAAARGATQREDLVRALACQDAMDRLHHKWSLPLRRDVRGAHATELLDLLADQVLSPQAALALLTGDAVETAGLAADAQTLAGRISPARPYPLLRSLSAAATGKEALLTWADAAATASAMHVPDGCRVVDLGAVQAAGGPDPDVAIGDEITCERLTEARLALWLAGADVDWGAHYEGTPHRRVSLPTYQFERTPHAPAPLSDGAAAESAVAAGADDDGHASLVELRPVWVPRDEPGRDGALERTLVVAPAHLLGEIRRDAGHDGRGDALAWAGFGDRRGRDGDVWLLRAGEPEDWRGLVGALRASAPPVTRAVVFAGTSEHGDGGTRGLDATAESTFLLVQALMRARVDEPVRVLHARRTSGDPDAGHVALAGLARCVRRESSMVRLSVLELDARDWQVAWRDVRAELAQAEPAERVRYRSATRFVEETQPAPAGDATPGPGGVRAGGVYLVTGGAGGLGRVVAERLLAVPDVKLALVGRSPRPASMPRTGGGRATYFQADVTEREAVGALVAQVTSRLGPIAGVIHAAGVLRDGFIVDKTLADLHAVCAPKMLGAVNLDWATKDEPLEFFALFSSVVALTGNLGQADYATANAFLDAFAGERERRHLAGERPGRTMSVGWPLWEAGGMSVGDGVSTIFRPALGLAAMPTSVGMAVLDEVLAGPSGTRAFLFGDGHRALPLLARDAAGPATGPVRRPATGAALEQAARYVAGVIAELMGVPVAEVDVTLDLDELGIDSILISQFNARAEHDLGTVGHTLLFESRTLADVAERIARQRPDELAVLLGAGSPDASLSGPADDVGGARPAPAARGAARRGGPVAVIGLSGRYPQAPDLGAFWDNLVAGRGAISEVPRSRWDYRTNFTEDARAALDGGGTYCKWGGFIDRADAFDPLFFNIAPREAELVDPQERIFLQAAWHALEDAGYPLHRLGPPGQREVGVFAGVTTLTYSLLGPDRWHAGDTAIPTSTQWSIANRVSYCLDLCGPSMPVDTACASALSAVHLACASLAAGECRAAIVGAVNLYLHPSKYDWLCQMQMLSPTGRCHSFGELADGFVPGEGVGAMLLKPLADAEADGDRIIAIIAGSAVNHGGRTSGFTVPNPNAQAELVRSALRAAGTDPSTIGYVEAHGTGTPLGDPIEIAGLSMAFDGDDPTGVGAREGCAIGSVKSNIGHLESAAGMAGLTKVLLQLRHGKLVPSLNAERGNPRIDFAATPFRLQRSLADWDRPRDLATGAELPRRAGISAFGAGGANAHVIVEEHLGARQRRGDGSGPRLAVVSARDLPRLQAHCANLAETLRAGAGELRLDEVAYQLQLRREPLSQRVALLAGDIDELADGLEAVARGEEPEVACWAGAAPSGRRAGTGTAPAAVAGEPDLAVLGERWVGGQEVQWASLYAAPLRHVDLPGYPFEERVCSIAPPATPDELAPRREPSHPFIARRSGDADFDADFTGAEFHLRDHLVDGQPVLPAVAYLELVRAGVRTLGADATRLRHNVWSSAITVAEPRRVHLGLVPASDGYEYTVFSLDGDERVTHAHGKVDVAAEHGLKAGETIDLDAIRARCAEVVPAADFYPRIHALGLQLGSSYQCIQELRLGDGEALSEIRLPAHLSGTHEQFVVHPCLFDSALQGSLGLIDRRERLDRLHLPFSIGALRVGERPPQRCFAHIVLRAWTPAGKKLDVRVTDAQGRVVAEVTDLWLRRWRTDGAPAAADEPGSCFRPEWVPAPQPASELPARAPVLLLVPSLPAGRAIEARLAELEPAAGAPIAVVPAAASARAEGGFALDPADARGFEQVADAVTAAAVRDIVFAWPQTPFTGRARELDAQLADGLTALLHLLGAMLRRTRGPLRILVVVPGDGDAGHPAYEALGGFMRTAGRESSRVTHRVLEIPAGDLADLRAGSGPAAAQIVDELADDWNRDRAVRYRAGRREARRWSPVTPAGAPALRRGAAYLVTGGGGGLGALVAAEIAATHGARLVLAGRRQPDARVDAALAAVAAAGGEAHYIAADVSREEGATAAVAAVRTRFGAIDGIFHCAGVLRDGYVINQNPTMLREVLAPKARGALLLDAATIGDDLDLFVLFSSVAGPLGTAGQAGYAYAGSFLDAFAGWREHLRQRGERAGVTYALDWPLWSDGGMGVDAEVLEALEATFAIRPLATRTGLDAMAAMLRGPSGQTLFVGHDGRKVAEQLGVRVAASAGAQDGAEVAVPAAPRRDTPPLRDHDVIGALAGLVAAEVAAIVKLEPARIDPGADIGDYGFDSLTFTRLANRLNATLGVDVTPALFFEYTSVADIAEHLLEEFPAELADRLAAEQRAGDAPAAASDDAAAANAAPAPPPVDEPAPPRAADPPRVLVSAAGEVPPAGAARAREPIAIVGLHGMLPQSEDLDEYWSHLEAGRDLVTEIPAERWDWRESYSPAMDGPNKTNSKWGGFLRDVDRFDHRFFGISPREAALMDPQQRLFLQTAYKAIEEAGYRPADLSKGRTGLYVGVSTHDYYELLSNAGVPIEAYTTTGMFHSILANRVSYLLNLNGPSFPIDTACSSSLVAVRSAVEAMWAGSCDVAIAGAVNLMLTPMVYISFARAGMLSPTGRCKAFDASADGYVRGEGVGALVLKPLSAAVRDRDHVHAVIRGSAVNHGGKVNTLTTPNPNAQADLIVQAFEEGGIDPATVGYMEMHGTGTALGDPIEVNGLKKAFNELRKRAGQPRLTEGATVVGSVKSNIGHLEPAAGIAGIFKAVLAMKHGRIPGNLHIDNVNPHIKLDGSPLRIATASQSWPRPVDESGAERPRRAGVSSFGFGGVNGHVLLEEYREPVAVEPDACQRVFVLSARADEQLRQYAAALAERVDSPRPAAGGDGADSADALQTIVAEVLGVDPSDVSRDEPIEDLGIEGLLLARLRDRIHDGFDAAGVNGSVQPSHSIDEIARRFGGRAGSAASNALPLADVAYTLQLGRTEMPRRLAVVATGADELARALRDFAAGAAAGPALHVTGHDEPGEPDGPPSFEDPHRVAEYWVRGGSVDWAALYDGTRPRRLSLPTYPFARTAHWIPAGERRVEPAARVAVAVAVAQGNDGASAARWIDASDRIVDEHRVGGRAVLPGVSHIELAAAALAERGVDPRCLTEVTWLRAVEVQSPGRELRVELTDTAGGVGYEVQGLHEGHWTAFSRGIWRTEQDVPQPPTVDLEAVGSRCPEALDADAVYQRFGAIDIHYGPYFRGIRDVRVGAGEALARIALADGEQDGAVPHFHPTTMDAALQAIATLGFARSAGDTTTRLPFSLGTLHKLRPLPHSGYVHVRARDNGSYDVTLLDEAGAACVVLLEIVVRERQARLARFLFSPYWAPQPLTAAARPAATGAGACLVVHPGRCFGLDDEIAARHGREQTWTMRLDTATARLGERSWTIAGGDAAGLASCLEQVGAVRHVWYLGGLLDVPGATGEIGSAASAADAIRPLFALVKSICAQDRIGQLESIRVIVNDVQDVDGRRIANPRAGALVGFCKSLARELPSVAIACVDAGIHAGAELADEARIALVDALGGEPAQNDGQEVVLLDGLRYVKRLRPLAPSGAARSPFRTGGVYVIVGGAGGIGLVLARHLVSSVAARVVLVGRSAADARIQARLDELSALGGEVSYVRGDVTDLAAMRPVIASVKERYGALHGVVHAAMVLRDGIVERLTEDDFETVLAPKLQGSLVLGELLAHEQLDFLLLMSSVQSFTGSGGQSNYAAASTVQDAIARGLASRAGYPVRVINWGFWGTVGRVATEEYRRSLAARGFRSIDPADGLAAIERVLLGDDHQVVAIAADEAVLGAIGADPPGAAASAPVVATLDAGLAGELEELERFVAESLLRALQQLGLWREPGRRHAPSDVLATIGAGARHERLVGGLVDVLVRDGYLADDGATLTATARCDDAPAARLAATERELRSRLPELGARLDLVGACLEALPRVLAGTVSAQEILFPAGSTRLVGAIYEGDRLVDYCNRLVAEQVCDLAAARGERTDEIRVLEVGAGTGSTTRPVLEALAGIEAPVRLEFTDLSPRFLHEAQRDLRSGHVTMRFRELDIERPAPAQGFDPASYHVVLAANVLHATRDIDAALRHVRELLVADGALVLTEVTQVQAFHTVTFGLLDAWWHFEDPERRLAGSPLLDTRMWKTRLARAGFAGATAYGAADAPGELAQRVLVARSDARAAVPAEHTQQVPPPAAPAATRPPVASANNAGEPLAPRLASLIAALAAECLGMPEPEIDRSTALSSIGVDSIVGVELISRINEALGIVVTTIAIFDHPTIDLLAAHIAGKYAGALAGWGAASDAPAPQQPEPDRAPNPAATPAPTLAAPPSSQAREPEGQRAAAAAQPVAGLRAVRFERPGDPAQLSIVEQVPVAPGPGEVEIAVKAFPINFSDFLLARGLYPMMPDFPFTPGVEVSGVVRRVGPGVERVAPGDEVIALMRPEMGGQSFVVLTDDTFVVRKPVGITHEEACGYPVAFLAMYLAFERAAVSAGERVLIPAATGTNGLVAVQLAQLAGAEVIATAGSEHKLAFLASIGVGAAINHRTSDVAAEVRRRTSGRGVDVIVNTVADDGALQMGLDLLAPDGRYVEIAVFGLQASGAVDLSRLVDNQSIHSFNTKKFFLRHPERRVGYLETMASHLEAGTVRPTVSQVFPFDRVAEAYAAKGDRETIGRVVVSVPGPAPSSAPAPAPRAPAAAAPERRRDIAIVGMSARFPGADDVEHLWKNLAGGVSSIREIPADRWAIAQYFDPDPTRLDATYCKWGGFLDGIDRFDASFFTISGKEAANTDPQQRVFLEESWRALEDAGYPSGELDGVRCGVFVGAGPSEYLTRMNKAGGVKPAQVFWGNEASILAARISYFLNLRGPSIAINTACSSSLVALHLACQSLLSGETELALAGGVFLTLAPDYLVVASNGNMLSPVGRCKTFDDSADGFAPGEGAGVLVLKPLDRALADGDHVHGVIKGTAINQDGRTNGITAPNGRAQTELELAAYEQAGIDPATIGYVEAHGTGTKLGDPIEIEALSVAFREHTDRTQFCPIGSIKTNIGHAAAAAGMAGIIKVLLAFRHRQIPPSLNFTTPNRHIDFARTPFYVNTELRDWDTPDGTPRRAAVSGFGFSGTNAHVVLEEPPPRAPTPVAAGGPVALPLSAKTPQALQARVRQLAAWLDTCPPEVSLAEIAYNLQTRRDHFDERLVLVASDRAQLRDRLREAPEAATSDPVAGAGASQAELAARFLRGEPVDWASAWPAALRRVALPTYPFDRTRHWFSEDDTVYAARADDALPQLVTTSPPGADWSLRATFTGEELYLREHLVDDEKILPGVMHLEVATQAALVAGVDADTIADVVWMRPFAVNGRHAGMDVRLRPAGPDVDFSIVSAENAETIYARGTLRGGGGASSPGSTMDLSQIERSCTSEVDPAVLYRRLRAAGLRHGPSLATVSALRTGPGVALGRLTLPATATERLGSYALHPALLDGALQILAAFDDHDERLFMPFSVDRVVRTAALVPRCLVHVVRQPNGSSGLRSFDVRLLNEAGNELVALLNLTTKPADGPSSSPLEDPQARLRAVLRRVQDGDVGTEQAHTMIGAILDD